MANFIRNIQSIVHWVISSALESVQTISLNKMRQLEQRQDKLKVYLKRTETELVL